MQSNFDVHEWNIQQIREANGFRGDFAAGKAIEFLRTKIYPKLSDADMDDFVVAMCKHFDCEPPAYRLNEEDYYTKFKGEETKLQKAFDQYSSKYNLQVSYFIAHSDGDKAMIKVVARNKEEIPEADWTKITNFVESQIKNLGFDDIKRTENSNYYEEEDEKTIYPTLQYTVKLK